MANVMKVLLQDLESRLYFKGMGGWTNEASEALDFENTSRAIEFWKDNDLLNVQIMLKYVDARYDVVLDVLPARQKVGAAKTA